jgi:hypothetical protein
LIFIRQSRDSQLLIRGGANYSYEQINNELSQFLVTNYHIPLSSFRLAVCGLKVTSEHEDDCCVMIEIFDNYHDNSDRDIINIIESTFVEKAKKSVSKGSKPDRLMIVGQHGTVHNHNKHADQSDIIHIPMVQSKGIVSIPELSKLWKSYLN